MVFHLLGQYVSPKWNLYLTTDKGTAILLLLNSKEVGYDIENL